VPDVDRAEDRRLQILRRIREDVGDLVERIETYGLGDDSDAI